MLLANTKSCLSRIRGENTWQDMITFDTPQIRKLHCTSAKTLTTDSVHFFYSVYSENTFLPPFFMLYMADFLNLATSVHA